MLKKGDVVAIYEHWMAEERFEGNATLRHRQRNGAWATSCEREGGEVWSVRFVDDDSRNSYLRAIKAG